MNDEWQVVKRPANIPSDLIIPLVSLRRSDISFNNHFIRHAELSKYRYVTSFVMPNKYKLGFKFHNDATDINANKLQNSRIVAAGRLYKENSWLKAITKIEDDRLKRFEPKKNADGLWEIQVCPAFENSSKSKSEISADIKGIYQYRRNGEVVYIGRGNIRDRVSSPERKEWEFDTIEYSIIEDESEQGRWEGYWLDQYVKEHARLPLYNRISGKKEK